MTYTKKVNFMKKTLFSCYKCFWAIKTSFETLCPLTVGNVVVIYLTPYEKRVSQEQSTGEVLLIIAYFSGIRCRIPASLR